MSYRIYFHSLYFQSFQSLTRAETGHTHIKPQIYKKNSTYNWS